MLKKCIYFSNFFYSYMVFGSVAISFRCAFLRGIERFLLRKNVSNFAEVTREKLFTTMTPLGISRDVTCHRLWRHNCFSNSIQFELIYFISIRTSQNLLKIRTFLCIRKRNELFDHPSYLLHNIRNWLNGNLGVLWQCRVLIQECYMCYLIILKYPLVQISVPKYPY